jgi:hypothetical protein
MFDGFTQLNNIMDNFKKILGEVGSIFSDVFGPALYTLNSILQIPFVQKTSAWVIAIGSVVTAYISLVALLKKINSSIKTQTDLLSKANLFQRETKAVNDVILAMDFKLLKIQSELTKKLEKQLQLRAKLAYLLDDSKGALLETPVQILSDSQMKKLLKQNPRSQFDFNAFFGGKVNFKNAKKMFNSIEETLVDKTMDEINKLNTDIFENLSNEIKNLSDSQKQAILESKGFSQALKDLTQGLMAGGQGAVVFSEVLANFLSSKRSVDLLFNDGSSTKVKLPDANKIKKLKNIWRDAAGLGATITAVLSGLTIKSGFTATLTAIKNGFAYIMAAIKGFVAGMGGVAAMLKGLLVASGWAVIIVGGLIALVDGIKMLYNVFTGQTWNQGTITGWIADWLSRRFRSARKDESN